MKNLFYLYVTGFLFFCTISHGQNIPRTWQEIPLFPGLVTDMEAQKQTLKDYQEIHDGEPIRDLRINVYSAKAVPDEVCRFYIEKLGAKDGFPEDNSNSPDPGKNTRPWYEVSYFHNSLFEDQNEGDIKIHDGKWFKDALSKRDQWTKGEWLQGAYFEWTITLSNGDMARFSVEPTDDDSIDSRAKTVKNKTLITIISQIEKSDEAEDDDGDS